MTSTLPPDPYKTLGVSKDAQITEIRSAHRRLVLKCHPDKVQDPALKAQKQDEFQKVQQAYELLSNDADRQKYDDQVRLADLREQMKKANISTPRSTAKYAEYDIRTTEPRASSYKPTSGHIPPAVTRTYNFSRSWEDDMSHGHRIFESTSKSTRRDQSYTESKSKRESEREREREREKDRERERERDRERRRKSDKEDAARRAEKDAKEARRAEKKHKEKQRDKDMKRDAEEKKKHVKSPYIEEYEDDTPTPKPEKKKSSGKKYDEKRDRSSHREEATSMPIPTATRSFSEYATSYVEATRVAPEPSSWTTADKLTNAASYIEASRAKEGVKRTVIYHARQPPAAPTPPPAQGSSPFAAPPMSPDDDDVRRSSARSRRGSTESARLREKYRKPSREPIQEDEPIILSASPSNRHSFQRSSTATPAVSTSPPHLSRTNTMPAEASFSRAVPPMQRAQTFNSYGEGSDPRGRNRSRMHPQINEESDSDDYEHRTRERKHRSGRRTHSPEPIYEDTSSRYPAYETRQSYSRRIDPESDRYPYYGSSGHADSRPSTGPTHFSKVKTSKSYGYDDAVYTHYQHKPPEEYTYA